MEWTPDELATVAQAKRFDEVWNGDPEFRSAMTVDPVAAVRSRGLTLGPDDFLGLWPGADGDDAGRPAPAVVLYRQYQDDRLRWPELARLTGSAADARFRAWRLRQLARCRSELGFDGDASLLHGPVAFELSRGCSVGCWFCGVAARKLDGVLAYAEGAAVWRRVIGAAADVLGPAAAAGFLYWATDPLDNPDYERFCDDFRARTGLFPPTTTAQPLRDAARTRGLLARSRAGGTKYNRFSVLSTGGLRRLHAEFRPDELLDIQLVLQMPGNPSVKSVSGRAAAGRRDDHVYDDSATIACVTGFVFHMLDGTVDLISPCRPDDRWPLGYRVYATRPFDAANVAGVLESLIADHMPTTVPAAAAVRFRRDLVVDVIPDGVRARGRFHTTVLRGGSVLAAVAARVTAGAVAAEVVRDASAAVGAPPADAAAALDRLARNGYLDDEPECPRYSLAVLPAPTPPIATPP